MACKSCKTIITVGLTCTVCENLITCIPCFEKDGHSHLMKEYVMVYDTAPLSDHGLLNALESGELTEIQYIPVLLKAYQNQERSGRSYYSLLKHIKVTGFICNCVFCKQMFLLYRHHSTKCKNNRCCTANCISITEKLLKRRRAESNTYAIEQKLLQGRLPVSTANAAASATTKEISDPAIASMMLARKFTIQRCVRTLVHACHCLENDCMPLSCQKMKRILSHIKICKRKVSGGCTICRQLSTLCCYHAKTCKENKCSVLLCSAIKRRLQQTKQPKQYCQVFNIPLK